MLFESESECDKGFNTCFLVVATMSFLEQGDVL